ncbi:hypothetical protein HC62_04235 [Acetobacter tropicalis]|uniref:Uncharacterized protein n=1 Tax=Acetobacter tropicalis TaxID=104102 RepID=A0A252AAB0_9PROT|nr:hypothetical protein HC62_04235 [Acetobacter tropicalis]
MAARSEGPVSGTQAGAVVSLRFKGLAGGIFSPWPARNSFCQACKAGSQTTFNKKEKTLVRVWRIATP